MQILDEFPLAFDRFVPLYSAQWSDERVNRMPKAEVALLSGLCATCASVCVSV